MKNTILLKAIATLTITFALALTAAAQKTASSQAAEKKRVNLNKLLNVLQNQLLEENEIVRVIQENGVDFQITKDVEQSLRNAGASDFLIKETGKNYRSQSEQNTISTTTASQTAIKSNGKCDQTIFGASGLPVQFYQTYTYQSYVINYGGESFNTKGVSGTLTLGPNGTYESELKIPGPYGTNYFRKSGKFCLDGDQIAFNYSDSEGEHVMKGTYAFSLSGLQLTLIIPDKSGNGDRETYGLVIKGTENVRRIVNADGSITIDN